MTQICPRNHNIAECGRTSNGLCRACNRLHVRKWQANNRIKMLRYLRDHRALVKAFFEWIKANIPCGNCKKFFDSRVIQFDHIYMSQKKRDLSTSQAWPMLAKELIKTRFLCSNCHSLRTAQQRELKWRLK